MVLTFFLYNSCDYKNANLFFNYFKWFKSFNNLGVEAAANLFQDALLKLLSSFIPAKKVNNKNNFPCWFDKNLKYLVWEKIKAHSIYMKNRTKSNYEIFSKLRAKYKSKSKSVYSEFIRRSGNEIKISPNKF